MCAQKEGSNFEQSKLDPILYYCWDVIAEDNIYLPRVDLQKYSESYSRVVDNYLSKYCKGDGRDVQPNSLISGRITFHPFQYKSYCLTYSGINYVYIHKLADLYYRYCDEFDILEAEKKKLDSEYREKIRCYAGMTGQLKLKKVRLDLKEEPLSEKEKKAAYETYSEHGDFSGLSLVANDRVLINDQGKVFKTSYNILNIFKSKSPEAESSANAPAADALKIRLSGNTLYVDAGSKTTVSREEVSGWKSDKIEGLVIGPGIKVLGSAAFAGWDLKKVTFDPKCKDVVVRRHCFENCIYLRTIECSNTPKFDLYSVHRTDLDDRSKKLLAAYPDAL